MKKLFGFILVFALIYFFSGCEKDDICIDVATPQLVIRFYDVTDTSEIKAVSGLRVTAILDGEKYAVLDSTSTEEVSLPLLVDDEVTTYEVISGYDSSDLTLSVIDTLNIGYVLNAVFKSRACGYAMTFEDITVTTPQNNWIKDVEVLTPNLIYNDTLNVKIYH